MSAVFSACASDGQPTLLGVSQHFGPAAVWHLQAVVVVESSRHQTRLTSSPVQRPVYFGRVRNAELGSLCKVPSPGLQVLAGSAFDPNECCMPRLHIPGARLAVDRPAGPQLPRSLKRPARPPITARAVAFPTISCCPGTVNVSGVECPTLPISQFGDGPSSGGLPGLPVPGPRSSDNFQQTQHK